MNKRQWQNLVKKSGWWEAYSKYLSSPSWRRLRKKVLKRDNNECQTCQNIEDYPLEIHHRRGHSSVPNCKSSDLIALCRSCHEAITNNDRQRRYQNKSVSTNIIPPARKRKLTSYGMASSEISISGNLSDDSAQRRFSKPNEQASKRNEAGIGQAREDRGRFRGVS